MKTPRLGTVYVVIPLGALDELATPTDVTTVQEMILPLVSHVVDDPDTADAITEHLGDGFRVVGRQTAPSADSGRCNGGETRS